MTVPTPRVSLALAIHNHQPVGNIGWVFADVFDRAYEPLISLLERHAGVRVALHYTGPLLQWLGRERPRFLDRVRDLAVRGQVELLGGGYYEPVLAALHERDRLAQLVRMGDELEALTGTRPAGCWLAERVWEPSLPTSIADAGYRWTIVDDVHLRAAGVPDEEHWSAYTTDDQGRRLTVFGTEQGLRYMIPFQDVEKVIEHLRAHATPAGDRLATMARSSAGGPGPLNTAGVAASGWSGSSGRSSQTRTGSPRSPRPPGWPSTRRSTASTCRPAPTPR